MKKNINAEAQTTENTTTQTETVNTTKKATKATTKKEDKKMTSTKKSETAKTATPTIVIPENLDQNILKAYKVNEAGELLMTEDMLKEFLEAHPELKKLNDPKKDELLKGLALKSAKKPFAKVRIDETAKKKQVHIHTGATKKVCSQKDEKSGIRYKVIFREKTQKYEMWSADAAGKRKMEKRGTEAEVMAEYNKVLGIKAETKATGKATKSTKKSA